MRTRRLTATFVTVVSATACSAPAGGTATPSRTSRPPVTVPADPAAALAGAKAQLSGESARFSNTTTSDALSYTGIVNAETKNWEITSKEYVVRRVGDQIYVKASGSTLTNMLLPKAPTAHLAAGGWVHTRLLNGSERTVTFNNKFPWNLANLAFNATGLTKTGDHSFAGKLISQDTRPSSTPRPDVKSLVDVDLDPQGRIARINLAPVTPRPAAKAVITFSDYGTPADIVAPPPADVMEQDNPWFLAGTGLP